MGFALWIEREVAWAEGTHEYRPMGVAVISVTDLFHSRDFHAGRAPRAERDRDFAGYFASVGDLNNYIRSRRNEPRNERQAAHPHHYGGVLSNS
jgi:hypothetical protein